MFTLNVKTIIQLATLLQLTVSLGIGVYAIEGLF